MSYKFPIVSIVAICYNHEKYLMECLQSVVDQTYKNIELIIVDDFSLDKSREKILAFCVKSPTVKYIFNKENRGNCRSLNEALNICTGKYIVDLSTDDVLMPNRIEQQVNKFEESDQIGVVTSDAKYINEKSKWLGDFYQKPESFRGGKVYEAILRKTFILPCTMMIRKSVLNELEGYDEALAYEDFDFLVRSSRICDYAHVPKILTMQRIISGSHSQSFTLKKNHLTRSAVKVCAKALTLNETESENQALIQRLKVLLRQCVFTENFMAGDHVVVMLGKLKGHGFQTRCFQFLNLAGLPLNFLYLKYIKFRRFIRFI
jgi:glycosyltransferase involved in cell wall biosynthesis